MPNNGCYGCTDRKVGCHSKCEKYKKWKEEYTKKEQLKRAGKCRYRAYFYQRGKIGEL